MAREKIRSKSYKSELPEGLAAVGLRVVGASLPRAGATKRWCNRTSG